LARLNICQTCRAFFEPDQKVCPHCGTSIVPRLVRERGGVFDRLASARYEVNLLVIFTNVVLYVVTVILSGGFQSVEGSLIRSFGAVNPEMVLALGGSNYKLIVQAGEWWRLVCPIFLHFSLLHIAFNCYVIRFAGQIAEGAYGSAKFFCLYLIAGIVGAAVSVAWNGVDLRYGAGASGAAFGILGLAGVYGIRSGDEGLRRVMFQWAFIALAFGLMSRGIDNAAHLGGLGAGVGLGFLVRTAARTRLSPAAVRFWDAAALLGVTLVILCFVLAVLTGGLVGAGP
jgi:membrane associated rhomboid family serine protease